MRASWVVAALAPLALTGGVMGLLANPSPPPAEKTRLLMQQYLAEASDVVVLGNSTSGTDIDRPTLATELGVAKVGNARVAAAGAPAWLASLETQVYGKGYRPRLVLVYGTLDAILAHTTPPGEATQRINDVSEGQSNTVTERMRGGRVRWLARASEARARVHSALTDWVRNTAVGLTFGGDGESLQARGAATATPALEALFGEGARLRRGRSGHTGPIAALPDAARFGSGGSVEEGFVPDMVRAAHTGGSRIVVVRAPDTPSAPASRSLEAEGARLAAFLNSVGAGYVDLDPLNFPPSYYRDRVHMNAAGRVALTERLVEEMARLDPLGSEPMPPAPVPVLSEAVTRTGSPRAPALSAFTAEGDCRYTARSDSFAGLGRAALVAAGLGDSSPLILRAGEERVAISANPRQLPTDCTLAAGAVARELQLSGPKGLREQDVALELNPDFPMALAGGQEAWWVYPGTAVRIDVTGAGQHTLRVSGRRIGAGAAELRVGSERVAVPQAEGAFDVELPNVSHGETWAVELASDAPFLRIEAVTLVSEGAERTLLGGVRPSVAALPRFTAVGRDVPLESLGGGRYAVPSLAPLSESSLQAKGAGNCRPIEVFVDGAAVPMSSMSRLERLAKPGWGLEEGILTVLPDGEVRATLSSRRLCLLGSMVYPGETLDTTLRPALDLLRFGVREVGLRLTGVGHAEGDSVRVTLTDRRGEVVAHTFSADQLDGIPVNLTVDPPRPTFTGSLRFQIENSSTTGFVVVSQVEFRDSPSE